MTNGVHLEVHPVFSCAKDQRLLPDPLLLPLDPLDPLDPELPERLPVFEPLEPLIPPELLLDPELPFLLDDPLDPVDPIESGLRFSSP
ncbi:MAG TPA: hypothetical protein VD758_06840 [Gemmatimonadaceae bacterium]|nr:hypothetical protein [Gemmatimonadaceae bacterium]